MEINKFKIIIDYLESICDRINSLEYKLDAKLKIAAVIKESTSLEQPMQIIDIHETPNGYIIRVR